MLAVGVSRYYKKQKLCDLGPCVDHVGMLLVVGVGFLLVFSKTSIRGENTPKKYPTSNMSCFVLVYLTFLIILIPFIN